MTASVYSSTVLDLSFMYVEWSQSLTSSPMVQAREFVARQPSCAIGGDAGGRVAAGAAAKDRGDPVANLLHRDRGRPLFVPDGLASPGTTWR